MEATVARSVATFLGPVGCVRAIKRIGDAINMGNKTKNNLHGVAASVSCGLRLASRLPLARLIQIDAARRVRQPRQRTHTLPNKELVQLTLTLQHGDGLTVTSDAD